MHLPERQILKNGFLWNDFFVVSFPWSSGKESLVWEGGRAFGQIHLGKQNFLDLEK